MRPRLRQRCAPAEAGAGAPSSDTLRRVVFSGLAWKGTSQVVTQVTRFGVAVILARLLSQHDYGVAGMVLVFMSFVLIFSDFALGNTLVQRATLTQADCSTAFWVSVAAGAAFTAIGAALALPVSFFFHEPALRLMITVLSFSFLIQSLGITQSALLVRSMSFRALESREMLGGIVGGAVAVAVALRGGGAWAIVAQQLVAAVASTVLVWRYSSWRPTREFSRASIRSFAGFAGNVFGTNVLGQLRGTSDNLLIGRVLGAAALGAYALAYNLVLVPFNRIAVPLSQVLFPALARIQDDRARIAGYWLRSLRLIAAVAMPSTVGLVVLAPDFVPTLLGAKWHTAVPICQLLAVVGLLQTLQFLNPIILQAVDRTSVLLRWSLFSYAASLAAFVVGLHWGAVGVAAAYASVSALTEPFYARLTARTLRLPLRELASALSGVAQASAIMGLVVLGGRMLLIEAGVEPGLRVLALVPLGAVGFAGGVAQRARGLVEECLLLLGRGGQPTPRGGADDAPGEGATSSKIAASSAVS